MTGKLQVFLLLAASVLLPATRVEQDANAGLMRSAVEFMQKDKYNTSKGVLKVDSRALPAGMGMRAALGRDDAGERHNASVLATMEIPSVSQVVLPVRSAQCATFAPADCMENGVSVVAVFGAPTMKSDTAIIEVLLLRSEWVSPADSLERIKRPGGIMGVRLRRAGRTFGHLTAVKEGAAWVVKSFKVAAQT